MLLLTSSTAMSNFSMKHTYFHNEKNSLGFSSGTGQELWFIFILVRLHRGTRIFTKANKYVPVTSQRTRNQTPWWRGAKLFNEHLIIFVWWRGPADIWLLVGTVPEASGRQFCQGSCCEPPKFNILVTDTLYPCWTQLIRKEKSLNRGDIKVPHCGPNVSSTKLHAEILPLVWWCWEMWWRLGGVVVCEWVGKEFPDMRQNERRVKFIRLGDAVRTVGQLEGEPTPFGG